MKAVGENPLEENIFDVEEDAIQCYTERFMDGENLAAFRSLTILPIIFCIFIISSQKRFQNIFPT